MKWPKQGVSHAHTYTHARTHARFVIVNIA